MKSFSNGAASMHSKTNARSDHADAVPKDDQHQVHLECAYREQVTLYLFLQAQARYDSISSYARLEGWLGIAHLGNAATCARMDDLGLFMPARRCQYPIAPTDSKSRHTRHALLRRINNKNLLTQAGCLMRGVMSPPPMEEDRAQAAHPSAP